MSKLKELRQRHNIVVEDLMADMKSKGYKISISTINRAEKTGSMNIKTAKSFAEYFGVELIDIIG